MKWTKESQNSSRKMAQFQLKNDGLKSQNIRASIRNLIIYFICCALWMEKQVCVDAFGYLVSIHHNIGYYEEEVMRNNGHFSFWLLTSRMSRLNFTLRPSFPFITFHRNLAPRATLLTNVGEFYYPYVIMCCEPRIDERRLQVSRSPHEFKNYSVPTQKFTKSQNAQ